MEPRKQELWPKKKKINNSIAEEALLRKDLAIVSIAIAVNRRGTDGMKIELSIMMKRWLANIDQYNIPHKS